jgi:hypothetical protein
LMTCLGGEAQELTSRAHLVDLGQGRRDRCSASTPVVNFPQPASRRGLQRCGWLAGDAINSMPDLEPSCCELSTGTGYRQLGHSDHVSLLVTSHQSNRRSSPSRGGASDDHAEVHVRKSNRGYGVWDSATNGWRSGVELDLREAEALAEQMNFDEWTARHIVARHPQDPAKPCSVLVDDRWWAGHLIEWGRSTDGTWWGAATASGKSGVAGYP